MHLRILEVHVLNRDHKVNISLTLIMLSGE